MPPRPPSSSLQTHVHPPSAAAAPPPQHLVLAGVGGACKLFLAAGARTSVAGQEHMAAALARPPGRGLVTVCNHVAAIDDPLVTAARESWAEGRGPARVDEQRGSRAGGVSPDGTLASATPSLSPAWPSPAPPSPPAPCSRPRRAAAAAVVAALDAVRHRPLL